MQIMQELAKQQQELAGQAREASDSARTILDGALRDNRRQLDEAMATMGAHMREELVRFQDEGQRRVQRVIEDLRQKEHDLLREEDRRMTQARQSLVNQHQGALEQQVKSMIGGLATSAIDGSGTTLTAQVQPATASTAGFAAGVARPATPLMQQPMQGAPQPQPFTQQ